MLFSDFSSNSYYLLCVEKKILEYVNEVYDKHVKEVFVYTIQANTKVSSEGQKTSVDSVITNRNIFNIFLRNKKIIEKYEMKEWIKLHKKFEAKHFGNSLFFSFVLRLSNAVLGTCDEILLSNPIEVITGKISLITQIPSVTSPITMSSSLSSTTATPIDNTTSIIISSADISSTTLSSFSTIPTSSASSGLSSTPPVSSSSTPDSPTSLPSHSFIWETDDDELMFRPYLGGRGIGNVFDNDGGMVEGMRIIETKYRDDRGILNVNFMFILCF
jgi:hypothetical protein